MATTNELINAEKQEYWADSNAQIEFEIFCEEMADLARREELKEQRRIFHLYCRTQEEIEQDPDYIDEF